MNQLFRKYFNRSVFLVIAFYALTIHGGIVIAGDYTMQKNMNDIAELMSKWSKQLSTGKLDPSTQKKLGEIMSQLSQVMHDMTGKGQGEMHMDHHNKIEKMKRAWDPFDTSDKM